MTSNCSGMSWQSLTPLSQCQLVGKTGHLLILVMRRLTDIVLLLSVEMTPYFVIELGWWGQFKSRWRFGVCIPVWNQVDGFEVVLSEWTLGNDWPHVLTLPSSLTYRRLPLILFQSLNKLESWRLGLFCWTFLHLVVVVQIPEKIEVLTIWLRNIFQVDSLHFSGYSLWFDIICPEFFLVFVHGHWDSNKAGRQPTQICIITGIERLEIYAV